ncbi:MAG: aspartate carbamoyltransferase, partial [Anaerotignum sp.]|nr:aspartate carbamoyltransferase [Anaerotignum sp.]
MESLQDMGQLIDQMGADFIILRHPMAGAPKLLADCVGASVINAGDGFNENPGQSLLDLLTIKEQKGGFEGLKVAIVGDLMHSRVSKSNIWGLTKLGAEVSVSGPSTLMLPEIEKFGVNVCYDAREAVNNADVILTTRMRMETQDKFFLPSLDEYKRFFRIDENLLKYAKKDAIVMHPGPIQRGIEISPGVIDGKQCIINDQIANSVAVRMAMFYILSQVGGAFK